MSSAPTPWLDFCSRTPSEESLTFQDVLFSLITAVNFSASCCSCLSFFRDSWNFSWKKHIKSSRVKCQIVSVPRHGMNGGESTLTSGDTRCQPWNEKLRRSKLPFTNKGWKPVRIGTFSFLQGNHLTMNHFKFFTLTANISPALNLSSPPAGLQQQSPLMQSQSWQASKRRSLLLVRRAFSRFTL